LFCLHIDCDDSSDINWIFAVYKCGCNLCILNGPSIIFGGGKRPLITRYGFKWPGFPFSLHLGFYIDPSHTPPPSAVCVKKGHFVTIKYIFCINDQMCDDQLPPSQINLPFGEREDEMENVHFPTRRSESGYSWWGWARRLCGNLIGRNADQQFCWLQHSFPAQWKEHPLIVVWGNATRSVFVAPSITNCQWQKVDNVVWLLFSFFTHVFSVWSILSTHLTTQSQMNHLNQSIPKTSNQYLVPPQNWISP